MKYWSDDIVKDLIGAFRVFVVSAILIYVALLIAKSLYPTFPFNNESYGVISVIVGLFIGFLNYTEKKNSF